MLSGLPLASVEREKVVESGEGRGGRDMWREKERGIKEMDAALYKRTKGSSIQRELSRQSATQDEDKGRW